jgi:hypothetical protein
MWLSVMAQSDHAGLGSGTHEELLGAYPGQR